MLFVFACALAFLFGVYISLHDLFNAKAKEMLFAFAWKSWALWAYGSIYGGLAILFFYLLKDNFLNVAIETAAARSLGEEFKIWLLAIFSGISIKSLLNVSFYNARIDGKTLPIGLATFVEIFEPQLIKILGDDHFICLDTFLTKADLRIEHLSLDDTRNLIRNTITSRYTKQEVTEFLLELATRGNKKEVLALYMRAFGKKTFCYTFPQK